MRARDQQRRCSYCGQPLPQVRLGARLPELKARIFDLVQYSGDAGIAPDTLTALAYADGDRVPWVHAKRSDKTLKAHIYQINELIEGAGYRIIYSNARAVYLLKNLNGKAQREAAE